MGGGGGRGIVERGRWRLTAMYVECRMVRGDAEVFPKPDNLSVNK